MLRSISSNQFEEWKIFSDLEPFDEERMDHRFAALLAAMLNSWRGKGQRAISVKEAIKRWLPFGDKEKVEDEKKPAQSPSQMKAMGRQMMALFHNPKKPKTR